MKFLMIILFLLTSSRVFSMENIRPYFAKSLIEKNLAVIIDVREPSETSYGYIAGAILVPMSTMKNNFSNFSSTIQLIPKNKSVIVYCVTGRRAQIVGKEIELKGYKVLNMGPFSAWVDAGYPVSIK